MTNFVVQILDAAVYEMREIYQYIRLDDEKTAKDIYQRIRNAISDLVNFPNRGSSLERLDKTMKGWRFVVVKPYIIFYRIKGNIITVYHVLDGRRDYLKLLEGDNEY